jgi:hypothetical protein
MRIAHFEQFLSYGVELFLNETSFVQRVVLQGQKIVLGLWPSRPSERILNLSPIHEPYIPREIA